MADEREGHLLAACKQGDLERVKELLAAGVALEARDKYQETPLIVATLSGQVAVVRELLARGADVKATRLNGGSALTFTRDLETTQLLLDHGAPLADASLGGTLDPGSIRLLVARGVPLDVPDKQQYTPLEWAVEHSSATRVKLFLELGAAVGTSYRIAIRNGDLDVLLLLLGTSPAPWLFQALFDACAAGEAEMVRALLALGAPREPTIRSGSTFWAEIEWLIAVEDPTCQLRSEPTQRLFAAIGQSDLAAASAALADGADPEAKNGRGQTPRYLALRHRDFALRALLGLPVPSQPTDWRSCEICQGIGEGYLSPTPPAVRDLEDIPSPTIGFDSLKQCPLCKALFKRAWYHDSDDPEDIDSVERLTEASALKWLQEALHHMPLRPYPQLDALFEQRFVAPPARAVSELIAALATAAAPQAAFELGRLGPAASTAVPALVACLGQHKVAGQAARALSRIGEPALFALTAALAEGELIPGAASALGLMGPAAAPARDVMLAACAQPSRAQSTLLWALGQLGYAASTVAFLLPRLVNNNDAIRAMGALGPQALPAVLQQVESDDRDVVQYSLEVLTWWGRDALPTLPRLQAMRRQHQHSMVNFKLEKAISAIRGWRRWGR